jgi:hypothetical protein
MSAVPGINALHAVITPVCRKNRGQDGAFDEAVRRIREEYDSVIKGWTENGKPDGINLHLVLSVERVT